MAPEHARGRRGWSYPLTIAAAAFAVGVLQFALTDRGGFWLDDFVNLAEARRLGLSFSLLIEPVYQHFAPGHRVLDWLVAVPFDRSYTAAVVIMALCIAGAVVACTLLLDECFGRRKIHLAFACAAGASWTMTDTSSWFAAAAHSLPSVLLTQVALLFFVRWLRTRRKAMYALALVTFLASLMFWELSLLFVLEAALLCLVLDDQLSVRDRMLRLLRALPGLTPFVLASLAYVIYVYEQPWHQPLTVPSGASLSHFTWIFILRGWLLPLVGTGPPAGPLDTFEFGTQLLAVAGVLAALAVAILTRRAVLRAALFLVSTFLVVWFAVAFYRLYGATVYVGSTGRLITPVPYLFWFAAALALRPAAGSTVRKRLVIRRWRVPRVPALAVVPLGAALIALYVLNLKHTDDVLWYGRLEGDAGSATAARIASGVGEARLLDILDDFVEGPVPSPVAFPGRWDDTLWRMGPYFDSGIRAIGAGTPLLTIDGSGTVREAKFEPVSGVGAVACQVQRACTVALHPRHSPQELTFVRVALDAAGSTRLRLASIPGPMPSDPVMHRPYFDDTTRHLVVGRGRHTFVLALWASGVRSAAVTATGAPVSLSAQVGVLVLEQPLP